MASEATGYDLNLSGSDNEEMKVDEGEAPASDETKVLTCELCGKTSQDCARRLRWSCPWLHPL